MNPGEIFAALELLEQERDMKFPEGEDRDGEGADDEEMPESTPGGGIDNMFGAYVNEEGREASIATTFSIGIEGKTQLVISLDNWETAKYVVLEQEEENVCPMFFHPLCLAPPNHHYYHSFVAFRNSEQGFLTPLG